MTELERLKDIIHVLRSENGCPWDRAQTHETLKAGCMEEAAEVIAAINILEETGDAENLMEELGDLLFHVLFHCVIAEEKGFFTFDDVAGNISDKMIRRHPHVFSGKHYASRSEQLEAWESIKKQEKQGKEWRAAYLSDAFDEAEALIQKARDRKGLPNKPK
ncbi:MAG: hypothetical protein K6C08_02595 [Oscillospiraceae bacterium]|nr:hypothetical protein [Oscillospiraceae bacterium]